jgi:hypothetical protein
MEARPDPSFTEPNEQNKHWRKSESQENRGGDQHSSLTGIGDATTALPAQPLRALVSCLASIDFGKARGGSVFIRGCSYGVPYNCLYTLAFRKMACTYSRVSVKGIDSTNSSGSRYLPLFSHSSTRSEPAL